MSGHGGIAPRSSQGMLDPLDKHAADGIGDGRHLRRDVVSSPITALGIGPASAPVAGRRSMTLRISVTDQRTWGVWPNAEWLIDHAWGSIVPSRTQGLQPKAHRFQRPGMRDLRLVRCVVPRDGLRCSTRQRESHAIDGPAVGHWGRPTMVTEGLDTRLLVSGVVRRRRIPTSDTKTLCRRGHPHARRRLGPTMLSGTSLPAATASETRRIEDTVRGCVSRESPPTAHSAAHPVCRPSHTTRWLPR